MTQIVRTVNDPDSPFSVFGNAVSKASGSGLGNFLGALISSFGNVEEKVEHEETERRTTFNFRNSKYGIPIAEGYGTVRLSGNVIYASAVVESIRYEKIGEQLVATESSFASAYAGAVVGGFFTGTHVEPIIVRHWDYSICMDVGICKGPCNAITRVWADSMKLWDVRDSTRKDRLEPAQFMQEAHLGRDVAYAQTPNTILTIWNGDSFNERDIANMQHIPEADLPRYNDLIHIFVNWFKLNETGFQIPIISAEISFNCSDASPIYDGNDVVAVLNRFPSIGTVPFLRERSVDEYYNTYTPSSLIPVLGFRDDGDVWTKYDPYIAQPLWVKFISYGADKGHVVNSTNAMVDSDGTAMIAKQYRPWLSNLNIYGHLDVSEVTLTLTGIDNDDKIDSFEYYKTEEYKQRVVNPDGSEEFTDTYQSDEELKFIRQDQFTSINDFSFSPLNMALSGTKTDINFQTNFQEMFLGTIVVEATVIEDFEWAGAAAAWASHGSDIASLAPAGADFLGLAPSGVPQSEDGIFTGQAITKEWQPGLTTIPIWLSKGLWEYGVITVSKWLELGGAFGLIDELNQQTTEPIVDPKDFMDKWINESVDDVVYGIPGASATNTIYRGRGIQKTSQGWPINLLEPGSSGDSPTIFRTVLTTARQGEAATAHYLVSVTSRVDLDAVREMHNTDNSGLAQELIHSEYKHKGTVFYTPDVTDPYYRYLPDGRQIGNSSLDGNMILAGGLVGGNKWLIKFDPRKLFYDTGGLEHPTLPDAIVDWVYQDAESAEHTADPIRGVPIISGKSTNKTHVANLKQGEWGYKYMSKDFGLDHPGESTEHNVARWWAASKFDWYAPRLKLSPSANQHSMTVIDTTYIPVTHSLFESGIAPHLPGRWKQIDLRNQFNRKLVWEIIDAEVTKVPQIKTTDNDYTTIVTEDTWGTFATSQQKIRDTISPLAECYFFDPVESDGKIKWIKKGSASVLSIPESEIILDAEMKMDQRSILETAKSYEIVYPDLDLDHQQGSQQHKFIITKAIQNKKLVVPVVLDSDEAAQTVDILHKMELITSESYEFNLPNKYIYLDANDVITIELDSGVDKIMRIVSTTLNSFGDIAITAHREDPSSDTYQSGRTGEVGFFESSTFPLQGRIKIVTFEIPNVLFETDGLSRIYTVAYVRHNKKYSIGLSGTTQGVKQTGNVNPTKWVLGIMGFEHDGVTTDTLAEAESTPAHGYWDFNNTILVTVLAGETPVSVTEEAIYNGQNMAFMEDSEVMSFKTVELVSEGVYRLKDLWRKRRNSDMLIGDTTAGSRIVQIYAGMPAFTYTNDVLPSTMYISATTATKSTSVTRTIRGLGFLPLPVTNLQGVDSSGDLVLTWNRRNSIDGILRPGTDIPLPAGGERYEIVFTDITNTIVGQYSTTSETFTYTTAQQITDFGTAQRQFITTVYQENDFDYGIGFLKTINLDEQKKLFYTDFSGDSLGALPADTSFLWKMETSDTANIIDLGGEAGKVIDLVYNGSKTREPNALMFDDFSLSSDVNMEITFKYETTGTISNHNLWGMLGIVLRASSEETAPSNTPNGFTSSYVNIMVSPDVGSTEGRVAVTTHSRTQTLSVLKLITPTNRDLVSIQNSGVGGDLLPSVWYTLKVHMYKNLLKVKLYQYIVGEPDEWDLVQQFRHGVADHLFVRAVGGVGISNQNKDVDVHIREVSIGLNGIPV